MNLKNEKKCVFFDKFIFIYTCIKEISLDGKGSRQGISIDYLLGKGLFDFQTLKMVLRSESRIEKKCSVNNCATQYIN